MTNIPKGSLQKTYAFTEQLGHLICHSKHFYYLLTFSLRFYLPANNRVVT